MAEHQELDRKPEDEERLVGKVRERYGEIARAGSSCCGSTCGSPDPGETARGIGYDPDAVDAVPDGANLGLGCGAPIEHLELRQGEVVLDLGSGGGFDAFLAALKVGQKGRVIGVDMTPEMIVRARDNATKAGLSNVEFREGRLEALPVDDASVDAVTSNCVINLVPDKSRVFEEIQRVLRSGGRVVISDVVLDGELPPVLAEDLLAYVGCVAGAMRRERYFGAIEAAGLSEIEVLSDTDFLASVKETLPPEMLEKVAASGVRKEQLEGLVRSVTFRAGKR